MQPVSAKHRAVQFSSVSERSCTTSALLSVPSGFAATASKLPIGVSGQSPSEVVLVSVVAEEIVEVELVTDVEESVVVVEVEVVTQVS